MSYYQFENEEGDRYGSFKTIRRRAGWFWRAGLHDEPVGPFASEEQAIADARRA